MSASASVSSGARSLSLSVGGPALPPLRTPILLFSTDGLTLPNLTRETAEQNGWNAQLARPPALLVPLRAVVKHREMLEKFGKGLASFMGFSPWPIVLTPSDPMVAAGEGYMEKRSVSVWSHGNRYKVDADRYMAVAAAAKPNVIVALADGETPKDASSKRLAKSMSSTLDFLDRCLSVKSWTPSLSDCLVFGAVQGGHDVDLRKKSSKATADRDAVDGFLIDGLHGNGPGSGNVDVAATLALVRASVSDLPESKPRMYQGCADPALVLDLVESGVDIFDSSYTHHLAVEGRAMNTGNILGSNGDADKEFAGDWNNEETVPFTRDFFSLDLMDACYKDDLSPISDSCNCLACQHHTRAYIHHLLTTNELLGPILLTMHNLRCYEVFFRDIIMSIEEGRFKSYKAALSARALDFHNSRDSPKKRKTSLL